MEDNQERLQQRLYRMFGTDVAPALYFSNAAKPLGGGLDQQIETFRREHPDTNLVIIDTLQKVRESGNEKCSYASDYEIISKLKSLAEKLRICLLLVHHTRKQQAEDRFDMISGTNGLLGCADGALILQKEFRTAKTATLDISAEINRINGCICRVTSRRLHGIWSVRRRSYGTRRQTRFCRR